MQLMPGTAREQSGKIGIDYQPAALTTDPNLSIMLGSSYFRANVCQLRQLPDGGCSV